MRVTFAGVPRAPRARAVRAHTVHRRAAAAAGAARGRHSVAWIKERKVRIYPRTCPCGYSRVLLRLNNNGITGARARARAEVRVGREWEVREAPPPRKVFFLLKILIY